MDTRIISSSIIIILAFVFVCIIGVKACNFADEVKTTEQNRIDAAFSVLENK